MSTGFCSQGTPGRECGSRTAIVHPSKLRRQAMRLVERRHRILLGHGDHRLPRTAPTGPGRYASTIHGVALDQAFDLCPGLRQQIRSTDDDRPPCMSTRTAMTCACLQHVWPDVPCCWWSDVSRFAERSWQFQAVDYVIRGIPNCRRSTWRGWLAESPTRDDPNLSYRVDGHPVHNMDVPLRPADSRARLVDASFFVDEAVRMFQSSDSSLSVMVVHRRAAT